MSTTLEFLDDSHKEKSTIILGENILLRFIANASPVEQRPALEKILDIPNLPSGPEIKSIKEIYRLSRQIKFNLEQYIQASAPITTAQTGTSIPSHISPLLQYFRQEIANHSRRIGEAERILDLVLSDVHTLYFCSNCHSYIGEVDNLTISCSKCGNTIDHENDFDRVSYLDKVTSGFVDGGLWLEDYIAKLLRSEGWKVWTHGTVMGTSGILHPIDLLAIKEGKVLIAECKVGHVSPQDISHYMVQKNDTASHYGFFFSVQACGNKNTAPLLRGTTSQLIDELDSKNDDVILREINAHIAKFP